MKIQIDIPHTSPLTRLDTVIAAHHHDCSRARAARLINSGVFLVGGKKKKPAYRVKPGDVISGEIQEQDINKEVLPENIPLDIVFEDDHILVINKQQGMVVHPAPGHFSGTLVNALLFHDPKIEGVGQDRSRAGIVHRLDKDTSGLMVVARTGRALDFLQREFKQRRVEKRYLALVSGDWDQMHGEINLPIGRHPVKRKLMAVNPEIGKPARTCWTVKKRFKSACLVEAVLKTGRTHQIRVHFYAMDHPLIGDRVYQSRRNRRKESIAARQMLHSRCLSFRHPYSGKRVFFKADLPDDFHQTMSLLERL